jgi:hypothetical protein
MANENNHITFSSSRISVFAALASELRNGKPFSLSVLLFYHWDIMQQDARLL